MEQKTLTASPLTPAPASPAPLHPTNALPVRVLSGWGVFLSLIEMALDRYAHDPSKEVVEGLQAAITQANALRAGWTDGRVDALNARLAAVAGVGRLEGGVE